ncbi:MAG: glycosyltransferase family 2 protein [Phycisphaerae bacterium]|nr:glycosyltransferase family 2 protein [Phycisphaerae bacterium]
MVADLSPANPQPGQPNAKPRSGLTVLIPAYNEAESITDTVRSIQDQTMPPEEIIVIDDFSSDNTGDVARALGVTVMRPPKNTGTKAGAQNFAMPHVKTPYVMAVDADTTLEPGACELLLNAISDPAISAACGFVIPRHVKTLWERGRYMEYLFAFTFYKPIQDFYDHPLISSGCFSIYRTDHLRDNGCWSNRTMAEDMDLTWSFYQAGRGVRFVPEAVCYPIEPHDRVLMGKQLKRWSHGFIQNVRQHWKGVLEVPFLRSSVFVAMWDAVIASFAYLIVIPLLAIFVNPLYLIGYLIDIPFVLIPAMVRGVQRGELLRVLASLPGYLILRIFNGIYMLKAVWLEIVMRRSLRVYEKGH